MCSAVGSWFSCVNDVCIYTARPILKKTLKQWEKDDKLKQAETFTKEEVLLFLNEAPN
jgi:hypothetical protein